MGDENEAAPAVGGVPVAGGAHGARHEGRGLGESRQVKVTSKCRKTTPAVLVKYRARGEARDNEPLQREVVVTGLHSERKSLLRRGLAERVSRAFTVGQGFVCLVIILGFPAAV